jgi:glycosyltransferase involved in cell wall biosynthesis
MNKITLIIATYNRTSYLKRAIDSIYELGFDDIILVNDGSLEKNTNIIKDILENYPKITYIEHSENLGLGTARNTGIKVSKTNWITFLDDDDYYIKNPLKELKDFITKNSEADIIHYKIRLSEEQKIVDWGHEKFTLNELVSYNRLAGCSLFKKSVWKTLKGFKQIPYEDWEFWIRAKQANFNFLFYPDVFYFRDNVDISLQNKTEEVLTDIDWKIKYLSNDLIKNSFDATIGIGISTFLRDDALFRLVNSNLKHLSEFKMYIVDQGVKNWKKELFYEKLINMGHIVKYIPYDSGISKSRRILKEICNEPYLVYMEDDFESGYKTNLYKMKKILDENPHIGVVGGNLQGYTKTGAYSFFLDYADNKICYFPLDYLVEKNLIQWKKTSSNITFIEANIVSDFTMWRKEVPNIFDDNVKTLEHTHVYLLLKYKTNYKVAFCPDVEIKHAHSQENPDYNILRKRTKDLLYLKKYWNVIDFYQFDKSKLSSIETNHSITQKIKPIKHEEQKEELNIEKNKVEPLTTTNIINNNYKPEEIFDILNKNCISYTLIKETCLKLVCKKEIDSIKICVTSLDEVEKINKLFPNNDFTITIEYIKETKCCSYKNIILKVPFPVVKYLEKTFNKSWQELQNGI